MWRELIRTCHPTLEPLAGEDPGPEFFSGATADALASVERHLGVRLPDSLSSLLTETNGVLVIFGTHLVWSTDEIVRRNRQMCTDPAYQERYMSFDHLLFFGDVDGYQFAFGLIQSIIRQDDLYLWNPYNDGPRARPCWMA
jgi:SMI1-KNR4 cell-wall